MFCSNCGKKAPSTASFCAHCGCALATGRQINLPSDTTGVQRSAFEISVERELEASEGTRRGETFFLIKLARGSYGLAKTFWSFGVIVWIVFTGSNVAALAFIDALGPSVANCITILFVAYLFFLIPGTWNAADKYGGPELLMISAKVVCLFWLIQLLSVVVRSIEIASL